MTTNQITERELKIITHHGKGYTVQVAANWKIQQVEENQTVFLGPKVGSLRIGFYVTALPKKGKNYLDAARISKASQSKENHYTVLEEKDITQQNVKALLRRSSWYNADKDMTLFVREIFTESDKEVFILSSTIPNSSDIAELDSAIVAMMNSFRFKS